MGEQKKCCGELLHGKPYETRNAVCDEAGNGCGGKHEREALIDLVLSLSDGEVGRVIDLARQLLVLQ